MGKLIMPKQTAKLDRFYYSLEIFYNAYLSNNPNVSNTDFKNQMTAHFNELLMHNNGAKIVKQSEMTRYFGMASHSYLNNSTSITNRGINFYSAYLNNNFQTCLDLIVESIINDSFGRNNTAIKSSDADVDPPKLFTRGIIDLNGISRADLSLLLYYIHDLQLSYTDACIRLKQVRSSSKNSTVVIPQTQTKYGDPKFNVFLSNIGFCEIDSNKRYQLTPYILSTYAKRLSKICIYNKIPNTMQHSNAILFQDITTDTKDTDCNNAYKENVSQSIAYDTNSSVFQQQNNRSPQLSAANSQSHRYPTDTRLAKTALKLAQYKCENNPSHITFTSKNNTPFMEAHHLIPMTAQSNFNINLDRTENLISLCPNCHSAVHYGADHERKIILKNLYNKRIKSLQNIGIQIDLNTLFSKYYC